MSEQQDINNDPNAKPSKDWTPAEKRDLRSMIIMGLTIFGAVAGTLIVIAILSSL